MFAAIETIKQNCRRCYTCVRSCPVKAIRIVDGQASVVTERCVACGRCTTVCSQNAKTCVSGVENTLALLEGDRPVAALLAPSYPAEFPEIEPERVAGALRTLGFRYVVEVARGADLVATAYEELLRNDPDGSWIATACPAIVERIRKYHPALLPRLAPIVSPMIAAALELRELHGDDLNCVFIGPCIAKKVEARDPLLPRVVDEALTFAELRRVFAQRGIDPSQAASSEPDPPRAGTGKAFPLIGGLLLSAGLESDPLDDRFIVATGRTETEEILTDLEQGGIRPRLVKALMCHGCHEGPLPPLRVRHTMRFSEASPPRIGGLLNQARNRSATSSPVRITFRQRMNSTAAHADIPPAGPRRLPSSMALPKKRCACPF